VTKTSQLFLFLHMINLNIWTAFEPFIVRSLDKGHKMDA